MISQSLLRIVLEDRFEGFGSRVKLLRKGRPFWNILDEYGIFSSVIRVPMTFPPEKLNEIGRASCRERV